MTPHPNLDSVFAKQKPYPHTTPSSRRLNSIALHSRDHAGPAPPDLVDVMPIAIGQLLDEPSWYIRTSQLELVSLEFCRRLRSRPVSEGVVRDTEDLDRLSMQQGEDGIVLQGRDMKVRAERLLSLETKSAIKVAWTVETANVILFNNFRANLWATKFLEIEGLWGGMELLDLPPGLFSLTFGKHFCLPINGIKWPKGLQELTIVGIWDSPLHGVTLPTRLRVLRLECSFDQPIEDVAWPNSIEEITLGGDLFNQAIHAVSWPKQLQTLTFGDAFNHSLSGLHWPSTLRSIKVGHAFRQPLVGITWPTSLRCLQLGCSWNEELRGVTFPESLRIVQFGHDFDQSTVDDVGWGGVTDISFGGTFNRIVSVGGLPKNVEKLSFGDAFSLRMYPRCRWPSSLLEMEVGKGVGRAIDKKKWPGSLQRLVLGGGFNSSIDRVHWPPDLKCLTLGDSFVQSVEKVQWPATLTHLGFGQRFQCVLTRVAWPPALIQLSLKGMCWDSCRMDAESCDWPATLLRVEFIGDKWLTTG